MSKITTAKLVSTSGLGAAPPGRGFAMAVL